MRRTDLRPRLEAIAAGRKVDAGDEASVIDLATVDKRQADFRAWYRFAAESRHGEALSAPAELLTPLP